MKYKVPFKTKVFITVTVEAENEDDAVEKAWDHVGGGLLRYIGNGGSDQLVGVYDPAVSLFPSEEVEEDGAARESS